MRGLDTNALLRVVLFDDEKQAATISRFLKRQARLKEPLLVTSVALCELVWVLRTTYQYDRARIAAVLEAIVTTDLIALDRPSTIHRAIERYGKGPGDFADYLIGEISFEAGCQDVCTFDRRLRGEHGFSLLG